MKEVSLLSQVLNDPKSLWEIKNIKVTVFGPWKEAKDEKKKIYYSQESECRFDPNENFGILICKSQSLEEPYPCLYQDYDYYNEDAYLNALAYFEEQKVKWKPWTVSFKGNVIYAESKEEAKEIADKLLDSHGILYFNIE